MSNKQTVSGYCRLCKKHWAVANYDIDFLNKNGFICPPCIDLWDHSASFPYPAATKPVSRFDLLDIEE